jgi:hypothetical protein
MHYRKQTSDMIHGGKLLKYLKLRPYKADKREAAALPSSRKRYLLYFSNTLRYKKKNIYTYMETLRNTESRNSL